MAQELTFTCDHCGHSISAWDDGNPYYIDVITEEKRYAWHPSDERDFCTGNDSPHLCLSCSEEFVVDSEDPITKCPRCGSKNIQDAYELTGCRGPFCNQGHFGEGVSTAIS